MTLTEFLTILAIFVGPIIAVQLTRFLDERREIKNRKLQIFKTLMATRAYALTWNHVEALNRIDLEFSKNNRDERAVLDAWKEYLDLLNSFNTMGLEQWTSKRTDLIVELLQKMAIVLKYDFDKTLIKNSTYIPKAHVDLEAEQATLRRMAIELLDGKRALAVTPRPPHEKDAKTG